MYKKHWLTFIESCYVVNGKMRKYLPPSIPLFAHHIRF